MKNPIEVIFFGGVATLILGIILMLLPNIGLVQQRAAFFTSTGLAMIVISWLRGSGTMKGQATENDAKARREGFFQKHAGSLIIGVCVLTGLSFLLISVLLIGWIEENGFSFEDVASQFENLTSPVGPTYYVFLIGLTYLLSSKENSPKV
jgi:hypothetical protein